MSTLFRRGRTPVASVEPSTGSLLVYAIGDVHGRLDLLKRLVVAVSRDALVTASDSRPKLILLGDYVDRGPDSRGVLDYLLRIRGEVGFDVRMLLGNHEQALLDFLEDPATGESWMQIGGDATLRSYGVAPPDGRLDAQGWRDVQSAFQAALPDAHLSLLRELELMVQFGDYAFVHAGVRPGVDLERQSARDLLWIRGEFTRFDGGHGKVIVHGHSASETAQLLPNRICVDTGAYATGVLTAVRLLGADQKLIQTGVR